MPSSSLQEMVPPRDWGEPMDAGAAPGLKRFSIEHLPNPLLALGLADVVWARGFLHKIETDLQELHRTRMSQPMAMSANGMSYSPSWRVEADLRELQRRGQAEKVGRTGSREKIISGSGVGPAGGELLNEAAGRLADELWAASAGNLELATTVLDRFWAKFSQESFRTPDLMSLLLVAHEEVLWETEGMVTGGQGPEGGPLRVGAPAIHLQAQNAGASHSAVEEMLAGGRSREGMESGLQVVASVPQVPGAQMVVSLEPRSEFAADVEKAAGKGKGMMAVEANEQRIRSAMKADVEVRLISIREMLWHYFAAYPQDYPAALAAVLGMSVAQVSDPGVLDERIAMEVARSGSWSLALRVWQEIVKHQKERQALEESGGMASRGREGGLGGPGHGGAGPGDELQSARDGLVPPQPRRGRTWWSWSPNWGGLNFGAALRALAARIFAS